MRYRSWVLQTFQLNTGWDSGQCFRKINTSRGNWTYQRPQEIHDAAYDRLFCPKVPCELILFRRSRDYLQANLSPGLQLRDDGCNIFKWLGLAQGPVATRWWEGWYDTMEVQRYKKQIYHLHTAEGRFWWHAIVWGKLHHRQGSQCFELQGSSSA